MTIVLMLNHDVSDVSRTYLAMPITYRIQDTLLFWLDY